MRNLSHPTRERLVMTVVAFLDERDPSRITVDEVLQESGISKGSLYHHFEDFSDLIEAALVRRFAQTVDASIAALTMVNVQARTREDLLQGLRTVTEETQQAELQPVRAERLRAIGLATTSERFRIALAAEQQRLTTALADLWREAQDRGMFTRDIDPYAAAVFIQAYTLGQVVNDITDEKMNVQAWIDMIDRITRLAFTTPEA